MGEIVGCYGVNGGYGFEGKFVEDHGEEEGENEGYGGCGCCGFVRHVVVVVVFVCCMGVGGGGFVEPIVIDSVMRLLQSHFGV